MSEEFDSNQPIKPWISKPQSSIPTLAGSTAPPIPPSYYGAMPQIPQSPGSGLPVDSFVSIPSGFALLKISWETYKKGWKKFVGLLIWPTLKFAIAALILTNLDSLFNFATGFLRISVPSPNVADLAFSILALLGSLVGFIALIVLYISYFGLFFLVGGFENNISRREAFSLGKSYFWSFIVIHILVFFTVLAGLLFLIIPGIIFSFWFIFAPFVLAIEDLRGVAALKRSRELVRGFWWTVFFRQLLFGIISFLPTIPITLIVSFIPNDYLVLARTSASFLQLLVYLIFIPLGIIYNFNLFQSLRAIKKTSVEVKVIQETSGWEKALIVIAVCIVPFLMLATISVVALGTAREKGRDTRRLTDIRGIQNALELYWADQKEEGYPAVSSPVVLGVDNAARLDASGWTNSSSSGNPVYMTNIPSNPTPGGSDYIYVSTDVSGAPCTQRPVCAAYTITFKLESGVGGHKAGELVATPPDIITEKGQSAGNNNSNSLLLTNSNSSYTSDDSDNDGLTDQQEILLKTDKNNSDSDNDGYKDGEEFNSGHDPLSAQNLNDNTSTNKIIPIPQLISDEYDLFRENEKIKKKGLEEGSMVKINVKDDREIDSSKPNEDLGEMGYASIGACTNYGNQINRYVGKFDFSTIDKNKEIESAVLRLDRVSLTWDKNDYRYEFNILSGAYDEKNVTWESVNNKILTLTPPIYGKLLPYSNFDFDITSLIKEWVSGQTKHYGFVVQREYESEVEIINSNSCIYGSFATSYYGSSGENQPYLLIKYVAQ